MFIVTGGLIPEDYTSDFRKEFYYENEAAEYLTSMGFVLKNKFYGAFMQRWIKDVEWTNPKNSRVEKVQMVANISEYWDKEL